MDEEKFLEYLTTLRDFGRIYSQKLFAGMYEELKVSQMRALYAFRYNDCLSMKELAVNLGVKFPNMTMMIDSLSKEGIVKRGRDQTDRRKVIVCLTRKGKNIRDNFLEQRRQIAALVFSRLDQKDRKRLLESLDIVCNILENNFHKDLVDMPNGKKERSQDE